MTLRLGTRASALAMAQSQQVADSIGQLLDVDVTLVAITTLGDTHKGSLSAMPQPGVFVSALRDALTAGDVDVVVHSMKDLPSEQPPGLAIAAVPPRVDARDVLVSCDGRVLNELARGARVGTGSPRRRARLLAARPDLEIVDLRGNVDSRIRRVREGELDAVVLAAAGLLRLGLSDEISEFLDPTVMLPAPAQGALAIECRADDDLCFQLAPLDHLPSRLATVAERRVLTVIEASCATAVAAHAWLDSRRLTLKAEVSGSSATQFAAYDGSADLEPGMPPLETALGLGEQAGRALLEAGAAEYANPR